MNWLDLLILLAIGVITYSAYRSGFVRELVSLGAVILAIPIAGVLYDDMVPKVEPIVDDRRLASLISFLAILVAVIVAGQVAAHLLRRGVRLLNLGAVDSIAGGAFGFLKAILIIQSLLLALILFPRPDIRNSVDGSALATRMLDGSPLILLFLPDSFEQGLDQFFSRFNDGNTV
ncbi:MAG: CvpA family protein [Dehalococcoidia bacterium]